MNKFYMNGKLIHKASDHNTKRCEVEKWVFLPHSDFERLKANPYQEHEAITAARDLMYEDKNAYHCIMLLDEYGEDGLLIEAEGFDYPRLSMFVPDAKSIYERYQTSEPELKLHDMIKDTVEKIAELAHTDKSDFTSADNHVTSVITLSGDESRIKAMLEQIKNDEVGIGSVDFNKILPMPESLHMTSGSIEDSAIAVCISAINPINEEYEGIQKMDVAEFREMLKKLPALSQKIDILMPENEAINLAENKYRESVRYLVDEGAKYISNLVKYGASTWYDWAVGNWGTKWNAYGYDNGVEMEDGKLKFLTAWAAPHPI